MKRVDIETTPEGRIAVVADYVLRHFTKIHKRLPDIADFREELRVQVTREVIIAKLEGLRIRRDKSDAEVHRMIFELADLI